ncbi:PH domain-containing protein [Luteimonas sp. Y-2-2-4F]|nr:PH domain-containing protein [Luteimonas sp. Y-2-2-4F]MCD9032995.1 PH domain-containing protein [Luteimonas sp. Y-2-2-4F]
MTTTPEPPATGEEAPATLAAAEAALPTEAERRLHPLSWVFVLLSQIGQMLLPLLAVAIFGARGEDSIRFALLMIVLAVLLAAAIWRYLTFTYRIGEDSVFVRSGVLERSLRQIPFSRIHDVALHQNLLHRLFGVAEVRLESAGGSRPEARMQVLALPEALALEQVIRRRSRPEPAPAAQAGDAAPAAPEARTLLTLPPGEVVRLGLVSNRGMVVVAGGFAVLMQVLPDDIAGDLLNRYAGEAFGYASHLAATWMQRAAAAALLLALALLALRLLSVALALVQYHGFRLVEDGRRLSVERGLLTRTRNSAPRRRIQAWTLHETPLHRLLRRRALHVDTAVISRGNELRGLSELAPIAAPETCDGLVRHLAGLDAWPPARWAPLHRRAWLRLLLPGALFAAALAAGLSWWFGAWGLLGLLWLPWSALVAVQHARRAGYALDARMLAVREGWWSRHWRFAEIDKLQALRLRRSPLDRWSGMASLWLDTAGAGAMSPPLRIRHLPVEEAQALLERLNAAVSRRRLRW